MTYLDEAPEREDYRDVVLVGRSCEALHRINGDVPPDVIEEAIRKITRPDSRRVNQAMSGN